jgi:hypothetical protein
MKTHLLNAPTSVECLRLVEFAFACGATTFNFTSDDRSVIDALQPFHIGLQNGQNINESRLRYIKLECWQLTADSLQAFRTSCPANLFRGQTTWAFFRRGALVLGLTPEASWLQLVQSQWEQLFRMGFSFSLIQLENVVYKEQFTSADLPENKKQHPRLISRKPKSVAEVLSNPWSLNSHAPAHGSRRPDHNALSNSLIAAWWTDSHDEILRAQIHRDGWKWWPSLPALIDVMDREIFEQWKVEDPECIKQGWHTVMTEFARARAVSARLTVDIVWPDDSRNCEICSETFSPSCHHRNIRKASVLFDRLCHSCIADSYNTSAISATREEIDHFTQQLAIALGRIPTSGYGRSHADYGLLTEANFVQVIRLLHRRPADARIQAIYGTWFEALIGAGLLEDGTRRLTRGTQCIANDGHVCLSLAEKTIDDLLTELGIPHQKEVPYPEGRFRCDFLADQTYIEYFGLRGDPDYDIKIELKIALCKRLGLRLVAIYPEDLLQRAVLESKLIPLKTLTAVSTSI